MHRVAARRKHAHGAVAVGDTHAAGAHDEERHRTVRNHGRVERRAPHELRSIRCSQCKSLHEIRQKIYIPLFQKKTSENIPKWHFVLVVGKIDACKYLERGRGRAAHMYAGQQKDDASVVAREAAAARGHAHNMHWRSEPPKMRSV